MIYPHEKNILKKIKDDYKKKNKEISNFYENNYCFLKEKIKKLDFEEKNKEVFDDFSKYINEYIIDLKRFSKENNITSQSKFESSFLEEINSFLFKNLKFIEDNDLSFGNEGIFSGIKINSNKKIDIIKKDVDFCIFKEVKIKIDDEDEMYLKIPIISIEVKTYLDATMLGEIKSSSRLIKNATPNSKFFVLIGYKNLSDEHLSVAKHDSSIDEIFVLKEDENSQIFSDVIFSYWREIAKSMHEAFLEEKFVAPGRMFKPE